MISSPIWAAKVNINKANAAVLQENLTGIDPVKAGAIIDYAESTARSSDSMA